MKLEKEDKLKILLQAETAAIEQMSEIKRDEMAWLKVFLLFYGAITAWIIARWFGAEISNINPQSEDALLSACIWFCLIATCIFSFLFMQTRHSYYGVRYRLHRVQNQMGLHDDTNWGGEKLFPPYHQPGEINNIASWNKYTKPFSSFSTRLVYIFGANATIDYLIYSAYKWISLPQGSYFLALWLLINLVVVFILFLYDYLHFR